MTRESIDVMNRARRALAVAACAVLVAGGVSAQAPALEESTWRIGASTGGYVPFSSLIRAADDHDTGLAAGPAFMIEPQYIASSMLSVYANGILAFGTVRLGSSIRSGVEGPSNRVTLGGATAGIVLTGEYWLGDHVQPTLRLGGGFKWYSFDLTDADSQLRPTADVGVGIRGIGVGVLEATAEIRYLPSSFDQSKLPTRGIAPQDQRQNDLLFSVGFAIRP